MPVNCEIYYTIQDGKGDKSKMAFPCTLPDYSDIPLVAVALGELIDPLVSGGIVDVGFGVKVDTPTLTSIANLASDVQEGARFVWRTVTGFFKSSRMPTVVETIFNEGEPSVDLTNTDVFNFNSAITDGFDTGLLGGSVGLATFGTTRSEDRVALEGAAEDWGRNR